MDSWQSQKHGLFLQMHFNPIRMLRKILSKTVLMRGSILTLTIVFISTETRSQCAMCRAVVEQGGEEVAEGINSGIVYLMAFPYIVVAVAFFLLYRNWRKTAAAS